MLYLLSILDVAVGVTMVITGYAALYDVEVKTIVSAGVIVCGVLAIISGAKLWP